MSRARNIPRLIRSAPDDEFWALLPSNSPAFGLTTHSPFGWILFNPIHWYTSLRSLDRVSNLNHIRKGRHDEQRSKQKKGFKERTGKNHERKKGGQKREERTKDEPWGHQSGTKNIMRWHFSSPGKGKRKSDLQRLDYDQKGTFT